MKKVLIAFLVALAPTFLAIALTHGLAGGREAVQSAQEQALVIDGARNPDLFPQWFVWESLLSSVPTVSEASGLDPRFRAPDKALGVSKEEYAFLLEERNAFEAARRQLASRIHATYAAMRASGSSEDEIRDATDRLNMEYRYGILDARQRIHDRLSIDSLQHLLARANRAMAGTTVELRGRQVRTFRLPR